MKPIVTDLRDISDSTEIYESKPNRFLVYTIYLFLLILAVGVGWMCLSKIDIVVKSDGMIRGNGAVYEISSGVSGTVKENHIENGKYVNEGDTLYVLHSDAISETVERYQDELNATKNRLEILKAYVKCLEGNEEALDNFKDNPYYLEISNRKNLLFASIDMNSENVDAQTQLYQGNIDSIKDTIDKYEKKISDLNAAKSCIISRNNTISSADSYNYSMVNSYITSYSYTELQYDNQISTCQNDIDAIDAQLASTDDEAEIEELKSQRATLEGSIESLKQEKEQSLKNLELQQIAEIEQQIASYNDTITSMETSLSSAELQLNSMNTSENDSKKEVSILSEKTNIESEISQYEEKLKECEAYLKSYDLQNNNCFIKANASGYFYSTKDFNEGTFVQEGETIGSIYPESEGQFYAEVYVENSSIAKLEEGQKTKLEIAAYPTSDYGYFEGTIEHISKDITVDEATGMSFYIVRVKCENTTLVGKNGEEAMLKNGMACRAKIIIDRERVMSYVLKKIDLKD